MRHRRSLVTAALILILGCVPRYKHYADLFKSSLKCGMTVEQVEPIALAHGGRFGCQRPGGGNLVCSAGWGREGVECVFDDRENLVAYRHLRIHPLTVVELLEERDLCLRGPE